jgi:hypothetical protein
MLLHATKLPPGSQLAAPGTPAQDAAEIPIHAFLEKQVVPFSKLRLAASCDFAMGASRPILQLQPWSLCL